MIAAVKLWSLRRKLRSSLAADPLQIRWHDWLARATSHAQLRESATQPGWLVHLAFWDEVASDRLLEAALLVAQLAIDHGPPNVSHVTTVMDMRQRTRAEIAAVIVDIEKRFPPARGIEQLLPAKSREGLAELTEARGEANLALPADFDLAKAGAAGAAAAGFSLALQAVFHRQRNARDSLTLATAGAAQLFSVALPDHRAELLATVRDRLQPATV